MKREIIIRAPRLEPRIGKIPKDFADVQNYFNTAIKENQMPWIPRKELITDEEIMNLWIPSLKTNITLVAALKYSKEELVVGQTTVFYDPHSSAYEHANKRVPGNIGFSVNPQCYRLIAARLIIGLKNELITQDKKAVWTTALESPGNEIMQKLGYTPKTLENQERYKKVGLSGRVCEYDLP